MVGPVGLRGEIKIFPTTDDPGRFDLLDEVYVDLAGDARLYTINGVRYHKNLVILRFEGVDSAEGAMALRGALLKIPPEQALPLDEDQYYHRDLLDMRVFEEGGRELGLLSRVLTTGANDVYVVKGQGEMLIPAIKQCVLDVDVANKRMTVRLLNGL